MSQPSGALGPSQLVLPEAAWLMTPARLGALQPSRVSFARALVNTMIRDRWRILRQQFDVDARGRGEAVYRVEMGGHVADFVCFSNEPERVNRTARIIGRNWDMMGALLDGPAAGGAIEQTRTEIPKLYEGRAAPATLVWCRSNRSLRAFEYVVGCLVAGRQPDCGALARSGYIMRNTGLDGNGTFGTRSFLAYETGHPLKVPYFPQMLAAYLMREFGADLADAVARHTSPRASTLDPQVRAYLGLGNGSGLGLVLWVNNHPKLVDRWLANRETAIARGLATPLDAAKQFLPLLDRAARYREEDPNQYDTLASGALVAKELRDVRARLRPHFCRADKGPNGDEQAERPGPNQPTSVGAALSPLLSQCSAELQEVVRSLCCELVPDLCDALVLQSVCDELLIGQPAMRVPDLIKLLDEQYEWAATIDLGRRSQDIVWYKSRNAEEPRRGPRVEAPDATSVALDMPLMIRQLRGLLAAEPPNQSVGTFLRHHPSERAIVERMQALASLRYHSVRMDMLSDDFNPVLIIRLVNSAFYGLDRTKDYLRQSLRGLMLQGAPGRDEVLEADSTAWFWPAMPTVGERSLVESA
jgi:hypothetical protein